MPKIHSLLIAAILIVMVLSVVSVSVSTTESYSPLFLFTIDSNGNMASVAVSAPSLDPIPDNVNILGFSNGGVVVATKAEIYTAYPSRRGQLLSSDSNGVLTAISTDLFNPCLVNGDPATNATMNGIPQPNGTCACRNHWSGTTPGKGCDVCDRTNGNYAGSDCQYSRADQCGGHGWADETGTCSKCDAGWAGRTVRCPYSDALTCSGNGTAQENGTCVCSTYVSAVTGSTRVFLGKGCQYGDNKTCGNGGEVDAEGVCRFTLRDGDIFRIYTGLLADAWDPKSKTSIRRPPGDYLKAGQFGCAAAYAPSLAFRGPPDANSMFQIMSDGSWKMVGGTYNGQYIAPMGNDTSCNGWGPEYHRILNLTPARSPWAPTLNVEFSGNVFNGVTRTWSISIPKIPAFGGPTTYIYLGDEYVCERFPDGGYFHDTPSAGNGGLNGPSHLLAGMGMDRRTPRQVVIEKMGLDKLFHPIHTIDMSGVTQTYTQPLFRS